MPRHYPHHVATALFLAGCALAPLSQNLAQCTAQLVWSDEFDGNSLDLGNWSYELGDGCDRDLCGWGNNELQSYRAENTTVADGTLRITARAEADGTRDYTSSRLISRGKQDFTYGYMEARMRLPAGGGLWPAFWMLSTDEVYGYWPQSGEIDIMEWVGNEPDRLLGTIHFGQPSPNNANTGNSIYAPDGTYADEWHEYAIDWSPERIRWFVDGYLFSEKTPADLNGERWPFDQDFFFILNMAVGGNLGGPVAEGIFPATLEVDYVRVYETSAPYLAGPSVATEGTQTSYTLGGAEGATVVWTGSGGATVSAGQGTDSVTVDWGSENGTVTAIVSTDCGSDTLVAAVAVRESYVRVGSLLNFDEPSDVTLLFASGTATEEDNPAPDDVNGSARVGRYARNAGEQYDVIVYGTEAITDADAFAEGTQRFSLDVWTEAPAGTEVLLQLETAGASNPYPAGRHSRYSATVTEVGAWQTLTFERLDRPDPAAGSGDVTQMVLLFAPNTRTAGVFLYDNLDVYAAESTPVQDRGDAAAPGLRVVGQPSASNTLRVEVEVPVAGAAVLTAHTTSGQLVARQPLGQLGAGSHTLTLDAAEWPRGSYVLGFSVGDHRVATSFVH